MNLDELEATLPNGLHDSFICSYTCFKEERRVEVELEVDVGQVDAEQQSDRTRLVRARLELLDVHRWEPEALHPLSLPLVPDSLCIDPSALSRIDPPLLFRSVPPRFSADRASICGCSGSVPARSAVDGSCLTVG